MKWLDLREGDVFYDSRPYGTTVRLVLTSEVLRDVSGRSDYTSEDRFVTYISLEDGRRGQMTTTSKEISNKFIVLREGVVI